MSWLEPTDFERYSRDEVLARWPAVLPLARVLAPATRIEPLLLRNARLHFFPQSEADLEYQLWFSPLVGARSSREIIFHPGVARLLVDELRQESSEGYQAARDFVREHTRHWSPEDRLEQDLRHYALEGDQAKIGAGLADILQSIGEEENEEQRIRLARWARQSLPQIAAPATASEEARLLAQYAAQALGSIAPWTELSAPQALPDWLAAKVPGGLPKARLAVELRRDGSAGPLVLHCLAAEAQGKAIELPTPLPARLHIAPAGHPGAWHTVAVGSRILVEPPVPPLRLTTLDGRQYELRAHSAPAGPEEAEAVPPQRIALSHVPEDADLARRLAAWFRAQGIAVELLAENAPTPEMPASGASGAPLLRLWTPAAREFWRRQEMTPHAGGRVCLLRTPGSEAPDGLSGAERLLDLPNLEDTAALGPLLQRLRAWLEGKEEEAEPELGPEPAPKDEEDEIAALLRQLDNPATEPPRRLAIGNRLAELGDPRPGVGVREMDVAVEDDRLPLSPEVSRLLAELDAPKTEPPRRLAIGDRLAQLGDPRPGVGLDGRGLPDIDWVAIPGGEFIYQGKKRSLPGFHLARYPITNAQYQAFVEAGGYEDERAWVVMKKHKSWWQGLMKPKYAKSRWPQPNRPKTDVDWYEATAFCRWLSAQLGFEVRLPTEAEWERAASGTDGRDYPWGRKYESGRANINETRNKAGKWKLEQTTAVGMYPHGASPEGVLDLSGNIWEWCANQYEDIKAVAPDDSGRGRALRGGAWFSKSDGARAGGRSNSGPDGRSFSLGFRVLCASPI